MSLPESDAHTCNGACIMDFPTAWAYVRERAVKHGTGEHDPECSFVQTNGALLCDCDVLWDEYVRRELPEGPVTRSNEETRRAIYENVAEGNVEIVGEQDGEHLFRVTPEGVARVDEIVDSFIAEHGEVAADVFATALNVPVEIAREIIQKSRADRGLV